MGGAISCGTTSLFQPLTNYDGPERRKHKRMPMTVGIKVQPLDPRQPSIEAPFSAVTRDISRGGLAYISSRKADFEIVSISLADSPNRMVICRVCACNLIQGTGTENVYLTSVEFLYERQL